jgi:hypothetical protein
MNHEQNEIDCDGHRSGVRLDDKQRLLEIGRALADGAQPMSVEAVWPRLGGWQ